MSLQCKYTNNVLKMNLSKLSYMDGWMDGWMVEKQFKGLLPKNYVNKPNWRWGLLVQRINTIFEKI